MARDISESGKLITKRAAAAASQREQLVDRVASRVPVGDWLDLLVSQAGDSYVFGVEVAASVDDPAAFDCSELVEWSLNHLGVSPRMVDGSWLQYRMCRDAGMLIPVQFGIERAGALLFRFSGGDPGSGPRPPHSHVAVSLGTGQTIEARSSSAGVGTFPAAGRGWTHAAMVPGVDYSEPEPWWAESWRIATGLGLLNGEAPMRPLTRAEFAAVLTRHEFGDFVRSLD